MLAKRILAGFFAMVVLLKLVLLALNPHFWVGAVQALQAHQTLVTLIYLVMIAITGYCIFSTLDLIDIAVAMFFTGMLIALSAIPYAGAMLKLPAEIIGIGLGKSWLAMMLWGALAVAVLYKIFSPGRGRRR
jgi:hypothetical protein